MVETEAKQDEYRLLHAEKALALRLGSTRQRITISELSGRRAIGSPWVS